jgi:hypothetical protein
MDHLLDPDDTRDRQLVADLRRLDGALEVARTLGDPETVRRLADEAERILGAA